MVGHCMTSESRFSPAVNMYTGGPEQTCEKPGYSKAAVLERQHREATQRQKDMLTEPQLPAI